MKSKVPWIAVALTLPLLAGCLAGTGGDTHFPLPGSETAVSGSGATFPKPLLETWGIEYAKVQPRIKVSYAGGGSGKGITDITNKDVAFAGSDAPMSVSEKEKAPQVLHIPETLGLVAVVYNVGGLSDGLRLDGNVVGKIYLGQIDRWNDAAIAALNPGVSLPDKSIAIVYRSDSSGTTFVFTDWLAKTSTDWASTMSSKASKKPDWTKSSATQLSGNGNDGVAQNVKNNPDTIGYLELAYVKSQNLAAAHLKNRDGMFIAPSTQGAQQAAASQANQLPAPDGDWSTISIINAPGADAYPVSSFSYILVHRSLSDYGGRVSADQLNGFRNWLWWSLHEGQAYAEPLGYAPLPDAVVKIGEGALESMNV